MLGYPDNGISQLLNVSKIFYFYCGCRKPGDRGAAGAGIGCPFGLSRYRELRGVFGGVDSPALAQGDEKQRNEPVTNIESNASCNSIETG